MKTLNNLLLLILCLGVTNLAMGQGGQDCSSATTPAYGLNSVSYTGTGASSSAVSCAAANFGADATSAGWFVFVPTNDGTISVASCEQGQDTRLSIYSGSCAALSCIGYVDDNCAQTVGGSNFAGEINNLAVTAGDSIFIEWDDRWTTTTHDWTFSHTYCSASNFDVAVVGTDATVTWNTASTSNYTYSYGPFGSVDPLQFTTAMGMSGATVTGMTPGAYDFYLLDSCFTDGVATGVTQIGPISVCVPGYSGVNAAPFTEGFEDCGIGGITDFWIQSTMDQADWTPNTGSTSSFQTGPSGPNEGNQYVYLEVTPMNLGDIAILESQQVDMTAVSQPAMRFDYHMYGSDMGTLIVEARDTGAWTQVWSHSGDLGDVWNTAAVDLSGFGDTIQVRFIGDDADPNFSGGGDIALDNIRFEDYCQAIMSAPFMDNFDGTTCMANSTMDVLDWQANTGGTPSVSTGPRDGFDGPTYMYIETSGALNEGDSAILVTPNLRMGSLSHPELRFAYSMYGFTMGSLRVEMSSDTGQTWTSIWEKSGQQGRGWHEARINLTNHNVGALATFRFVGARGTNWGSDIALDAVSIQNGYDVDLVTTDILTNYTGCVGAGIPAVFEITNYGFTDVTDGFTYGVMVNGTMVSQFYADTILAGESMIFTIPNAINLQAGSNNLSYGFVGSDINDEDQTNDFLDETTDAADDAIGSGYATSFEATADGWYGTNDFELGVPAGTNISGAGDGTDAWVTVLDANYDNDQVSYLYSPCFDFSGFVSDPNVVFDVNWDIETDWDGAWLEVSTDGGISYAKIGAMNTGTNWYNSDVSANNPIGEVWSGDATNGGSSGGWVEASNRVMGTAGMQTVQFRFVMWSDVSADAEGLGVDNFRIEDYCPVDLGLGTVVTMATPGAAGDASASVAATAGTAPYSYMWSDGQTTAIASGLDGNMTYSVIVTDANGCTDSTSVTTMFTNTNLIETMTSFDVFPNPTNTTANVVLAFEEALDVNIELVNVLGQVVFADRQEGATNINLSYDVSNLSAGVYMVRIMANGQKTSRRLVITE